MYKQGNIDQQQLNSGEAGTSNLDASCLLADVNRIKCSLTTAYQADHENGSGPATEAELATA